MPEPNVSLHMLYEKVGEVGAIAREAKHAANNASSKIDALALIVTAQGQLRDHVERIERERSKDHDEIEALKADKLRREGAVGLVEALRRYWPVTLLFSALGVLVAWANGKLG